ncbi:MAG: GIY-YIG nuclease family protein [Gammaproteobacteria bacterium]|nr:GIY-YIG nuclease family protein [Gammaproteobacteria bacterium]
MPYVYVLYSLRDGKKYTGLCFSLRKRLSEHKEGRVRSTAHRRPLVLVYYEWCRSWRDARKRELYLKTSGGKRYLNNRLKHTLAVLKGRKIENSQDDKEGSEEGQA